MGSGRHTSCHSSKSRVLNRLFLWSLGLNRLFLCSLVLNRLFPCFAFVLVCFWSDPVCGSTNLAPKSRVKEHGVARRQAVCRGCGENIPAAELCRNLPAGYAVCFGSTFGAKLVDPHIGVSSKTNKCKRQHPRLAFGSPN